MPEVCDKPAHVQIVRARNGSVYSYYKRGKFRRPILGDIGSQAWLHRYRRIHEQFEQQMKAAA
jgi:hypothetical protein